MPIPADNGDPKAERDAQNKRIIEVAEKGVCVQKEVTLNPMAPKEKCIFGDM